VGKYNPDGPTIQPCLSGGLWNAGASITIKQTHIANWLIGQVLNEEQATEFLFSTQLSKLVTNGESKDFTEGREKLVQLIAKQPDLNMLLEVWDKMTELYQNGSLLSH